MHEDMKALVKSLNEYTELYDCGRPVISDKEWDELYFRLVDLEKEAGYTLPDSPTQKIEYKVMSSLEKVTHNHPMLSLAKTKDWNEFLNYFYDINYSKDVIGTVKLDGLTCSLRYLNGKLISAETRGNGEIGEDITHNARVIKSIPNQIKYYDELIIDGEIICTYKDFEEFKNDYKNPRNFAAGSIRLLDSSECAKRKLTFVSWNVVKGFEPENSFMRKLIKLEELGFEVTPYASSFDWDAKEFLQDQAKESGYPIDGLVGRFDEIDFGESLGATDHHSRAAFAFKFYDEEYETTLKDIEWTMGRTGVLTPVAIFEPIEADGSVIERASLHNISIAKATLGNCPHRGQSIRVFKANMIIPQISFADKEPTRDNLIYLPSKCPICGGLVLTEKENETEILVCKNLSCEGRLINRLDHFVGKKGLDIKGLSKMTLEKLINWNWVSSIKDIFELKNHRQEWINKSGFGVKSVDNILGAIESSKECDLSKFICAIGIPLIGENISKIIEAKEKTWDKFREDIDKKYTFWKWDDFGLETHKTILGFDYTEADEIVKNYLTFKEKNDIIEENKELENLVVVITGSLKMYKNRDVLKNEIQSRGGKVSDSISKKVSCLVNNDIDSASSKNVAAKKLNIPILSEEEFTKKYLTL